MENMSGYEGQEVVAPPGRPPFWPGTPRRTFQTKPFLMVTSLRFAGGAAAAAGGAAAGEGAVYTEDPLYTESPLYIPRPPRARSARLTRGARTRGALYI